MANRRILDGLIVGGGITGLTVAHWLGLDKSPNGWELWEASDRAGGVVGTVHADGYSVDSGPNGFLDREPLMLRLVDEIGLADHLEPANQNAAHRFIVKDGRLHEAPLSQGAMMKTGLLSLGEKLRLMGEMTVPPFSGDGDESIFDFAERRFGKGAATNLVDPVVSGIFAGDARQLSLPSCFPSIRKLEQEHGSLIRAMTAKKEEKTETNEPTSGLSGPVGNLVSFFGGIATLTNRLHERLGSVVRLNHRVSTVAHSEDMWTVSTDTGQSVQTRRLILTCPLHASAQMLDTLAPELSASLSTIPYAPVAVVATGHRRKDIKHSLNGFGFLIPRNQGMRLLGSIWTSSIFAGRAPESHVLIRSMLGGATDPDILQLSDAELWKIVCVEAGPSIGITDDPVFVRVFRWERGIPQYTIGHRERRAKIESLTAKHPGLHLSGNAFYGVGINDCVKMARQVADRIAASPIP